MKRGFVNTDNVKKFKAAIDRLQSREEQVPGMALIYGEPGLGKTKAVASWCAQNVNNSFFIRTKKLMTGRWLLEELVSELGEQADKRVPDLYRQARNILMEKQCTVFFDEVDYLCHDARVIETLRDLHDDTGTPIVLVGMAEAEKKLSRYRHLYDRFSEIVKFQDLTELDVRTIADEMCDVKVTDDAIRYIHSQGSRFRKIVIQLYRCEAIAKRNSLKEITGAHLQAWRRK
ncbi:MAG: ATP-binding protein [Nitrospirae bacterium]|nr:ATP-binding protein [Nitrospirota bacterium]